MRIMKHILAYIDLKCDVYAAYAPRSGSYLSVNLIVRKVYDK